MKKYAILIDAPVVVKSIEMVIKVIDSWSEFVSALDAEVVISNNPAEILSALQDGKEVIQLIMPGTQEVPLIGITENPDFAPRFKMYQVVETYDGIPPFAEFIK